MGQTLTHGVYLPDEGERNCYSGLAANWQLLDGAVGTVAEHTSALTGKAPLVHTHTKSDITDFPAYGNAAGTICEGNDSRLSDARTPVAHTHTKSDVTDLFNSANTWDGNNTYTATINYQSSYTLGNPPQNDTAQVAIRVADAAGSNYLAQMSTYQNIEATGYRITIRDKFDSNGFSPSGSNRNKYFYFLQGTSNRGYLQWEGFINNHINPLASNTYNLGASAYQWNNLYAKKVNTQSVNDINPGALSLPDIARYTDLTSNIPSASLDGTTNIDLSPYITSNGWLSIVVRDTNTDDFVFVQVIKTLADRYFMSGARGLNFISLMMPINRAGDVLVQIKASSVTFCRFYQCLGNV